MVEACRIDECMGKSRGICSVPAVEAGIIRRTDVASCQRLPGLAIQFIHLQG